MILTPGVLIVTVPLQVTGLIEPGRFAGTGKLRPEKNVLPFISDGTVVIHIPPAKVVVAVTAEGSNVTLASGTESGPKFGLVMV